MIGKARTWTISFPKWILTVLLFTPHHTLRGENNYATHKTNQIPWNMLLDPNYLSHQSPITSNRTSFAPSTYDEYVTSAPYSHPHRQNSFTPVRESTNLGAYYVPPPRKQFNSNQNVKYSPPYAVHEPKPSYAFSVPVASHQPSRKVTFPGETHHQGGKLESSSYETVPQKKNQKGQQKVKDSDKRKQKKRKPDDYQDLEEDDYFDSYFEDYDYFEVKRPSSRPLRQTSTSHKYKDVADPMGLLPSASDPEGFFSKAKDLLRGASRNKPGYSPSASEFYPNFPPNKQYEDSTGYGEQPYYGQENLGYPSKDGHYGSPGYDYDTPYGDTHYGGGIPYPLDKRKGSKYGPLAFALGLLPLGLLLASLVPTVVTIPVTTAVAQGRRRKRSIQFVNPVLETISKYGVAALEDPSCLNRIFCQVVRDGQQERSSIVQKLYFKIAGILDEKIAASVGLQELLIAVRKDQCHVFQCSAQRKSIESKKRSQ